MKKIVFAVVFFAALGLRAEDTNLGPSRVDFDDRLVKGQRRGTGAIYIFERQKVELRSMVKKPRSFRRRIVMTVFEE